MPPDGSSEPLIHSAREGSPDDEPLPTPDVPDEFVPSLFIWTLTLSACLSGLLFGYDTGVISSTLVSISTALSGRPLTTLDKSLITSSTSLTALLSSTLSGHFADTLGRRPVILLADGAFVAGALIQAFAGEVWVMILGRSVVGAAVGAASFVVPLYIGEMAPARWRGRLVTVSSLFVTGGQMLAYIVGWGLSARVGGWRWMVGLGALPALVQAVCLVGMPESPRWLVKAGRGEGAKGVLRRVYGVSRGGRDGLERDGIVERVLRGVEREVEEEDRATKGVGTGHWERARATFIELWLVGGNFRALVIACMLQGAQQLCGFNSLMYFSATIFAMVGFRSPTLTALCIATTNFVFTLAAFQAIDRIGRRRILLLSMPVMVLGLALCAIAFSFVHIPNTADSHPAPSPPWPVLIVLSMVVYVAAYALGLGCVPWQQSELFALRVRSLGSALATATNWGSNFVVGLTFLPLMELISPTGTFAVYALVCAVSWGAVWQIYPETAGLGLEEVGGLLAEGWGVKESLRRFRGRVGG
ncbi:general substrate transporter [Trichodelitschia bisporula]|uniref:General substrate transporter n=1 Tax=Trichodelitschia bisporula TaxID=703511 RepID=A0A6G1HSI4_9PEZI|nr:general substrate transporter [Trichodelitschia bisporula]